MRVIHAYGPGIVVLVTVVLVLSIGPGVVRSLAYRDTQVRMVLARERLDASPLLEQLNMAYRDIAAFVEPSVVHISASQSVSSDRGRLSRSAISSGSGWIYDDLGHVVTNYHVVQDVDRIEVQLSSGETRRATVVGFDALTDIAVLRIAPGLLHPATRGNASEPLRQGDLVFTFGSPFDFRFSMSSGVVSGQGRSVDVIRDRSGRSGYENFIQVDAAINPGNSGGPLTDFRGRVIGMNTAIATGRRSTFEEGQFAGIGLAIPLSMIEPTVEQIIEKGFVDKGFLGVSIATIAERERLEVGFIGQGVLVLGIDEGGPASRTDLQPMDVIVGVGGTAVRSTPQLQAVISSVRPGGIVALDVWRRGDPTGTSRRIDVELGRLDPLTVRGEIPPDQSREHLLPLGIARMTTATPESTAAAGVTMHPGVLVKEIVPGSELSAAMAPGSIITLVADHPVAGVDEFLFRLRQYDLRANVFGGGTTVGFVSPDGRQGTARLRIPS